MSEEPETTEVPMWKLYARECLAHNATRQQLADATARVAWWRERAINGLAWGYQVDPDRRMDKDAAFARAESELDERAASIPAADTDGSRTSNHTIDGIPCQTIERLPTPASGDVRLITQADRDAIRAEVREALGDFEPRDDY